jgi:catechol 2,3-dioxygenase-like lactoylglutathione lyase family enzyme
MPIRSKASVTCAIVLLSLCSPAQAQLIEPFDHLHLAVPDVEQARDWYIEHLGGNPGETPDAVAWGKWPVDHPLPIQLLFALSDSARPSAGSAIDHIGFSFADLDAAVDTLRAAGVTIVSPVTEIPGLGKQAVARDPWGTTLVLVQDPDTLGIHHVELRVADPEESLRWYSRVFGGERTKYKGLADGVLYRGLGVFYLFAVKDEDAAPSPGHSIDHLGFGPVDLDTVVKALDADGVAFISNPNPRLNPACRVVAADSQKNGQGVQRLYCEDPPQLAHRTVFLDAPGGVRIELVQHLEAGGH